MLFARIAVVAAALAAASQMPMLPASRRSHGHSSPGWIASSMPMIAVNTISATTRGLVSVQYCDRGESVLLMPSATGSVPAG